MTPEVEQAIAEIKATFPEHEITVEAEAQGGANVMVHNLSIGQQYAPEISWVGFQIGFQYPHADVYPHFIEGVVKRADGQGFGTGLSGPIDWQGRSVIQVSRRSGRWNPASDTAATKLAKVLLWLRSQ